MNQENNDVLDMPIKDTKCINCGKNATRRFAPFCSERCKNLDLGKWLTGAYAIAGQDGDAINEIIDKKELDI